MAGAAYARGPRVRGAAQRAVRSPSAAMIGEAAVAAAPGRMARGYLTKVFKSVQRAGEGAAAEEAEGVGPLLDQAGDDGGDLAFEQRRQVAVERGVHGDLLQAE